MAESTAEPAAKKVGEEISRSAEEIGMLLHVDAKA